MSKENFQLKENINAHTSNLAIGVLYDPHKALLDT
jgi:hypothetical protein